MPSGGHEESDRAYGRAVTRGAGDAVFPGLWFLRDSLDARAVVFNVTVVAPTGSGNLRIWPYNTEMPLVSTINFDAGEPAIANGAIAPLKDDATAQISVFLQSGLGTSSDLILDVTGYFQ